MPQEIKLTEEEIKAIEHEALKHFPVVPDVGYITDRYEPMRIVWIAATTTERQRSKVLLEALENILATFEKDYGTPDEMIGMAMGLTEIESITKTTIDQYKLNSIHPQK